MHPLIAFLYVLLTGISIENPLIFLIWFLILAAGCFGGVGGYVTGRHWFGWGGAVFLFLAILMLKLFPF